jgi:ER-bound oxygenase mpaB/B'/Rubber oxygenase, catalytic domain
VATVRTDNNHPGMSHVGDPQAAEMLVTAARRTNRTFRDLLLTLRKPEADQPVWMSSLMQEWSQQARSEPSWADPSLISEGQGFFQQYDLAICTALFTASLPSAYSGHRGAAVLAHVSQLADPRTVALRVAETGQLLLDMTAPGGLDRDAPGYRRIVQVRMLHAAVRAVLNEPAATGERTVGAVPSVNQEDLRATLATFTIITFRALDRMGFKVSPAEKRAYLRLWSVVAEMLGIDDAATFHEAANEVTDFLEQRLQGSSAEGTFLTAVLLDEMESCMPIGCLRLPRTMIRFLAGDRVADLLGVPRSAWWFPALPLLAALNRRVSGRQRDRKARIRTFPSHVLGRRMIQMWIERQERGEGAAFAVSDMRRQSMECAS